MVSSAYGPLHEALDVLEAILGESNVVSECPERKRLLARALSIGEAARALSIGIPEKNIQKARLRTFNTQPDQTRFTLSSVPFQMFSPNPEVVGCPWCRRPLTLELENIKKPSGVRCVKNNNSDSEKSIFAHVSVLYGNKHTYFLGAVVLGHSLRKSAHDRVLLVTKDVPEEYRNILRRVWSRVDEVEYVRIYHEVSDRLFRNPKKTRFGDVFTKLQIFRLVEYEEILFLDLDTLVLDIKTVDNLFTTLSAPAALIRGDRKEINHGDPVPYRVFWEGYERKKWPDSCESSEGDCQWTWCYTNNAWKDGCQRTDGSSVESLPSCEQANGINAGVMLLKPSDSILNLIREECRDWSHPQHYPTFMPEQEYLGRLLACVDFGRKEQRSLDGKPEAEGWSHLSPRFNFEVDKNLRVPFDFSTEHERLAEEMSGIKILHFSGKSCKPWDAAFFRLLVDNTPEEELEKKVEFVLQSEWGEDEPSTRRISHHIAEWLRHFSCTEEFLGLSLLEVAAHSESWRANFER